MDDLRDRVTKIEDRVEAFEAAFPNGDLPGHCRAHQALIDDVEARKRLRQAIAEKTISGLIWAAIVGGAIAIWHEVLKQLGRA